MLRLLPLLLATTLLLSGPSCGDESPPAGQADESSPATRAAPPVSDNPLRVSETDWPWWRGPQRNGISGSSQAAPVSWSDKKNVIWKAAVPGRGHGSASIVGSRVFVATADRKAQTQSLLCFDRKSGKPLWQTVVHSGNLETRGNDKSSQASCTPACDGTHVYVNFLNNGTVYTTALDLEGKQAWQTAVTKYSTHQGFSSSPCLYGPLVLVSADTRAGGVIAAVERASGKIVWKHDRPKKANYTSPIVLTAGNRDQALMVGTNLVAAFDPLSGRKLWEIEGATTECVTSIVTDGTRVFTSGGYPRNHISAILADGSGKTAWKNSNRVYVPSMLAHKGTLYAVLDAGIATALDSGTGKLLWKQRLGGTYSSSLVLAAGNLYATSERGVTTIFKADRGGFQLVGKNQLGSEVLTSMAICGGRIYHRVAVTAGGKRQEWLYCLGTGH